MNLASDNNYFTIDHSVSWKDIADKMDQLPTTREDIIDDGLAELSRSLDHGQLAIDIYETPSDLIVESPVSGVKPENLEISINNDVLTIKGSRERSKKIKKEDMLYQEVHWGSFSRSIVLPYEVISDRIEASLEDGILKVRLPKASKTRTVKVKVK